MSKGWTIAITAIVTGILTSGFWILVGVVSFGTFMTGMNGLGVFEGFEEPEFAIGYEAPSQVTVGQPVVLKVWASNPTEAPLELSTIDVYDSLFDGFDIQQVQPVPVGTQSMLDFEIYTFDRTLEPGETFTATFTMVAKEAGTWSGDVDFCDAESDFVTSVVLIEVVDPAGSPAP